MEEFWVEEIVNGDVPVCWYDVGYDLAQRVIEMALKVVHYYTRCRSNSKEDQQSAQLYGELKFGGFGLDGRKVAQLSPFFGLLLA